MDDAAHADHDAVTVQGLDGACDAIVGMLAVSSKARPLVGITGPVASGKSTLADRLARRLGGLVLSTDRYLPDYSTLEDHQRDEPEFSDLARLSDDLAMLRATGQASVPVWSFHEHRRQGEETVRSEGPVVCEGLFALHDSLTSSYEVRVFVEAPTSTRWARWEAIERAGLRGWGVERAREHFEAVAEPTFSRLAGGYRSSAHVIVFNDTHGAS